MPILFECEYKGDRFAGFDRPEAGEPQRLYRVTEEQLATTLAELGNPAALPAAIAADSEEVTVPGGQPELRYLPPLLPASGNALVSGFMRTHKSKTGPRSEGGEVDPPKWFVKGFGSWLRMPEESLTVPAAPVALIEEPEIVLAYVNDYAGTPHYAGYTFGNDLCDIGLHLKDSGYNPYCKLCDTSISPWLFLAEPPRSVNGRVSIERAGEIAWQGGFDCGLDALYYTLEDMPEHLFTYPALRRPGMVNYILLGADSASFHDGFRIAHGDRVSIHFMSHDVELSNVVEFATANATAVA